MKNSEVKNEDKTATNLKEYFEKNIEDVMKFLI